MNVIDLKDEYVETSFGRVETFHQGYWDRFPGVVFPLETPVEDLSSVTSFCLCVCVTPTRNEATDDVN